MRSAQLTQLNDGSKAYQKLKDVRLSNIAAAKAADDAVRRSPSLRGMDKMLQSARGDVLITNDGDKVLENMKIGHPCAKMLVQLSELQDTVAFDGTTTVADLCCTYLKAYLDFLKCDINPFLISDALPVPCRMRVPSSSAPLCQ